MATRLKSYKELTVWQKSIELVREVYVATGKLPNLELYGLTSQMRRCAVSIPSNIAEGYTRRNLKEYLQFLGIADASSAELETQVIIAKMLYREVNFEMVEALLGEVQRMLHALVRKLQERNR